MENEKDFVRYFKKLVKDYACCTLVENSVSTGFADMLMSCFNRHYLIEFKFRKRWPVRKTTELKFTHYTNSQYRFLNLHHGLGGNTYIAVMIEGDILLFAPDKSDILRKGGTKQQYIDHAEIFLDSTITNGDRSRLLRLNFMERYA